MYRVRRAAAVGASAGDLEQPRLAAARFTGRGGVPGEHRHRLQDKFHDFYPARAHIGWVTQLPLLLALPSISAWPTLRCWRSSRSAALFALPAALYQLAMARVRGDGLLLAIVLAIVAAVYLPTSFFIIGEYNATYAAVTAAMAVVLTSDGRRRDGALLAGVGRALSPAGRTRRWSISVRWMRRRRAVDDVAKARSRARRYRPPVRHGRGGGLRGRRAGVGHHHGGILEPSALRAGGAPPCRTSGRTCSSSSRSVGLGLIVAAGLPGRGRRGVSLAARRSC